MLPTRHYFANAVGVVDYLPGHYAYLHLSGAPLGSLELRALYIHTRNLLQRESLCCLLADHRAMPTAPTLADQQWLLHTWLPQTIVETGYSHCAVLPAPDPARPTACTRPQSWLNCSSTCYSPYLRTSTTPILGCIRS